MTSQVFELARQIFIRAASRDVWNQGMWQALPEHCFDLARDFYAHRQTVSMEDDNANDNKSNTR